ncbi:MAG: L,D-transpeptidase family protein [Chitinophagaceae bacterium]|nr:L,D-transpeptidase family protein [Chitinophagaceae bacterium]
MRYLFFIAAVSVCGIYSCAQKKAGEVVTVSEVRDTTITAQNAFSELFFDSTALESYIAAHQLNDTESRQFRDFYNARNYQYAWFFKDGLAEQAYNFLNQQTDYVQYSGDTSLTNPVLKQILDTLESGGQVTFMSDSNRLNTELLLTTQFFRYAENAYQGSSSLNASDLKWFIPRKKIDLVATLDSLIAHKGDRSAAYEPLNIYYQRLKQSLLRYYEIEKAGGWQPVLTNKKKLQQGDTGEVIIAIKNRLRLTGDFDLADSSGLFTDSLATAVKRFQHRYGVKEDGVIGPAMLKEINMPVEKRIRQMLINLERMRWVPAKVEGDFLLVNIPEFKLHIFEDSKPVYAMNVVVGTNQNNTVIFYGDLKYIVFSPYWNVPPGILKNEVLPGMKKDKNYLAKHNMEIAGYTTGGLPNVRQKPGSNNSLGKVKFLFPNNYNIYMHDTPAKSLFGESRRAFSHGCIRLGEPKKLAEFLLRNDSTWTSAAIDKAMNSGKEKYVTLRDAIPVFIGYFTAWVDSKGDLNFRDDIYGHDARIEKKMFSNRQ